MFGIGLIIANSPSLFSVIKIAGALYLIGSVLMGLGLSLAFTDMSH